MYYDYSNIDLEDMEIQQEFYESMIFQDEYDDNEGNLIETDTWGICGDSVEGGK